MSESRDELLKKLGELTLHVEEIEGTIRIYQHSLEAWKVSKAEIIRQIEKLQKAKENNECL